MVHDIQLGVIMECMIHQLFCIKYTFCQVTLTTRQLPSQLPINILDGTANRFVLWPFATYSLPLGQERTKHTRHLSSES